MKRNHWIVIVTILAVVAAGLTLFDLGAFRHPEISAPTKAPTTAQRPAPAPSTVQAPQRVAPSFDAVHVGADGKTVIAGRAAPGAEVTVLDRGTSIGRVTADSNGEFVFMPEKPLAPGPQQLSLSAVGPGATGKPTPSTRSLAVVVPERQPGEEASPPVAVLLPQDGRGAARPAQALSPRAAHHIALDIVEYDAAGRTLLGGRADPGAHIAIFVNDRRIGAAAADTEGSWNVALDTGIPIGHYRLRLDGGAAGMLEVALVRAAPGALGPGSYFAVVPGNTLWHLAQHSYGDGVRYVEIYRANRNKIENPDLIYPNQLLAVPTKPD
ncbi:MAG TPA: Ig-like domain-containing protein [Stellaceae bacterium]|nr:Ig-like domain-containing protein [Stellaceae bacterium]